MLTGKFRPCGSTLGGERPILRHNEIGQRLTPRLVGPDEDFGKHQLVAGEELPWAN